jgi:hypothetical protein
MWPDVLYANDVHPPLHMLAYTHFEQYPPRLSELKFLL